MAVTGAGAVASTFVAGAVWAMGTALAHADDGDRLKITVHQTWAGGVPYVNIDGQNDGGTWWPWSHSIKTSE